MTRIENNAHAVHLVTTEENTVLNAAVHRKHTVPQLGTNCRHSAVITTREGRDGSKRCKVFIDADKYALPRMEIVLGKECDMKLLPLMDRKLQ